MGATHLSLHYHLIFSTKKRILLIENQWRERLHAYVGGAAKSLEAIPQAIGGVADHIHILLGLRATHCLADVMRDLKRSTSAWIHDTIGQPKFAWQDGYGAFTVSASQVPAVKQYIAEQEEHHRTRTFQEEYMAMLTKSGVAFDPRFLE
jgi:putative transposase